MAQLSTGQTASRRPQFGSSNPCSWFTVTCNSSSRDPLPSDGPCATIQTSVQTHTYTQNLTLNTKWKYKKMKGDRSYF